MEQDSVVLYNVENGVATITLNRPEKHNAFDDNVIANITDLLDRAKNDSDVRALVLRSNGKTFCAGADLNWMQRMVNYSEAENQADAMKLATMLNNLYQFPKPTIARVQGAAFGGAVGLIACCDIAVASKLSKFCLSEAKIGLIPATISPFVIQAMGERTARRYAMTSEVFSSRRARRLGLIQESVNEEELDETVSHFVSSLLKNGPEAVSQTKALFHDMKGQSINHDLLTDTSQRIAKVRVSAEGQEGLNAFLGKRAPSWKQETPQ